MNLAGKVALVTGAGQGIGRAIALKLAAVGADLALVDLNPATVQETAAEIEKLGRRAIGTPLSFAKQPALRQRRLLRERPCQVYVIAYLRPPLDLRGGRRRVHIGVTAGSFRFLSGRVRRAPRPLWRRHIGVGQTFLSAHPPPGRQKCLPHSQF